MTGKVVDVTTASVSVCTKAAQRQLSAGPAIERHAHPVEPDYFVAGLCSKSFDYCGVGQLVAYLDDVPNKIGHRVINAQRCIQATGRDRRVGPQRMDFANQSD